MAFASNSGNEINENGNEQVGWEVALVTGGGGEIGRATAMRYVEEGAKVIVSDIDEAAGNTTAEVANNAAGNNGGEAIFFAPM